MSLPSTSCVHTRVQTIEDFIADLKTWQDQGFSHVAVAYGAMHGSLIAPSKKVPLYRIPMTLHGDLFEDKNCVNVEPAGGNMPAMVLLIAETNAHKVPVIPKMGLGVQG